MLISVIVILQIWAYVCIQFGNYIFRMIHYALFNYLTTMTLQYHSACYDTHACYIHTYIHTSIVFRLTNMITFRMPGFSKLIIFGLLNWFLVLAK